MTLRPSPAALASTGLPESALAAIQRVLAAHPAVEQAILYGSRALGRHRPASDIDLTLLGLDLSSTALARINAELDDLLLPWVIDLSCHASLRPSRLAGSHRAGRAGAVRAGCADVGPAGGRDAANTITTNTTTARPCTTTNPPANSAALNCLLNSARHARFARTTGLDSAAAGRAAESGWSSSRPWPCSGRAFGKTSVALQLAASLPSLYLDLEATADRARLAEPSLFLERHADKLVILDEVQRLPGLFAELRGLIDAGRRSGRGVGRFLLLGSASVELIRQSSESLAGRIAFLELQGLNLLELGPGLQDFLWIRGGFPESVLDRSEAGSAEWRRLR